MTLSRFLKRKVEVSIFRKSTWGALWIHYPEKLVILFKHKFSENVPTKNKEIFVQENLLKLCSFVRRESVALKPLYILYLSLPPQLNITEATLQVDMIKKMGLGLPWWPSG